MRPVVQVRVADAGDMFMAWRWVTVAQGFGTGQAPADEVVAAVAELSAALPGDLREAFAGTLCDPEAELALAGMLSAAVWPEGLSDQIRQVGAVGRPLVRIQPSPRVAQVPWELLTVGDGQRLLDIADVVTTVPVSVGGRQPSSAIGPPVHVFDPRVPGAKFGSVLGDPPPELAALAAIRRDDQDRDWLSAALKAGPGRLMYVGHVSSAPVASGQSEDAQLHLSCRKELPGYAAPIRTHRPLSAKDLLLGTLPDGVPGADLWPSPPRVALIACESGGELRFAEPFGLATAMLHNGAELVTATRWPLPTTHAFHELTGVPETAHPLADLTIAVDKAHESPDPIANVADWQRSRLAQWRAGGDVADSPLLWSALTTIVR